MKVKVTTLNRNGVRIDAKRLNAPIEGDMYVASEKHEVLGRLCVTADLHSDTSPVPLLPTLYDVAIDSMSANGFRVRGTEIGPGGALVAQEWWCQPVTSITTPS